VRMPEAVSRLMSTVLVIEDIADNARLASRVLSAHGFTVLHSSDALSGFHMAVDQHPDIILVDVGLPDNDGLTLVGWMRRVPELANIPIIAVTAWPREAIQTMIEAYGCDGYISKPISVGTFADQVAAFLPAG
jgi:two-component system cell cycle response regulator DivK